MTTWNRRLSAANQRQRPAFSKEDVLREAVSLGVQADDQAALLALARVAANRPGYCTTLIVRTDDERPIVFEVTHTPSGPVARPSAEPPPAGDDAIAARDATAAAPAAAGSAGPTGDDTAEGPDILRILTDTLVQTPDLVAVFASVGHEALWANDAFVTLVPIRAADRIWLVELLDEWSKGHYEVKVLPALVKYGRWRGRLTLLTGDREPMPVSAVIVAHRDRRGEIEAVSMVARELPDAVGTDSGGQAREGRFAALVEHTNDVIAVLGADGTIEFASPATTRILGHPDGALEGVNLLELIHPDDVPDDLISLARRDEQGIGSPVELRVKAADGTWRYFELIVSDLTANPAIGGLVLNARDVTERVEALNALVARAFTDPLTGLPNRVRLLDRLEQALQRAQGDGRPVAVILVDLDGFRSVHEGYGRQVADCALVEVGDRLTGVAGPDATTARLRSDEFAVVLPAVDDPAEAVRTASRLLAAVREPITVDGSRIELTASLGVAFGRSGDEPEDLLRDADHAMAIAKEAGGDRIETYSEAIAEQSSRRRNVEQRLRQVIDDESIVVHYQPIIDVGSETVVAAEALLRVQEGDGTLLSPAEFIDAAESTGLITRLGSQVLNLTCSQLAAWLQRGGGPQAVSVNLSPRQLADPDLPNHVLQALNASGVPAERLWLEITESMLLGHQATIDASVSYLRTLGVRIGLDEFGAGHSSLGYLKRFPLDFVKIDRSLVAGLGRSEQDTAIVRATIELAHNLGLVVVAVGVETDDQLEMLRLLGCDRVQGYLFAPPSAPDDLVSQSPGGGA
ncbi:MAG: bifunctional diguanylate cyclase/phosphodiesterase [Acidimicrobiales bacterium]